MFILNDTALLECLDSLPESAEYHIPDGMTEQELDYMLRALQAKNSDEIADISTDQIIALFEHIESVATLIGNSTLFDNYGNYPHGSFEKSLLQLPSAKRRRVL